jgi:hypothetical protein
LCVVGLVCLWATAAPQPKVIPTEWELDLVYQPPTPIRVHVPGEPGEQTFWYVLYSVTNVTGDDRTFVPQVTLYTDTGQIRQGDEGIYPSVFTAIKNRYNSPYLMDLSRITGTILQGEDNARDGVAIFRDFDPAARSIDVFIGGFSGETAVVDLPAKVLVDETDVRGETRRVLKDTMVLHKTLQLTYQVPGEAAARFSVQPRLSSTQYVMR